MNVSKGMNHLLKSPFCVHPKTGRICVPITVEDCEIFEPDRVPTLQGIIQDARSGESKPGKKNKKKLCLLVEFLLKFRLAKS